MGDLFSVPKLSVGVEPKIMGFYPPNHPFGNMGFPLFSPSILEGYYLPLFLGFSTRVLLTIPRNPYEIPQTGRSFQPPTEVRVECFYAHAAVEQLQS